MNGLQSLYTALIRISTTSPWTVFLVKVSLLLAAAWLLYFVLARANPRWRVFLWRGVFAGLALLPLWSLGLPGYEIHVASLPESHPPTIQLPLPPVSADRDSPVFRQGPVLPTEASVSDEKTARAARVPHDVHTTAIRSVESSGRFLLPVGPITLFAVWGIGAALLVVRLAIGYLQVARQIQGSRVAPDAVLTEARQIAAALRCHRKVQVRICRQAASPFLYGLRRSCIVLPDRSCWSASGSDLRGVLAHELVHVRSYDFGWNAAWRILSIAFWFHPLVWRIGSAHRAGCDAVCDAVSASYLGDVQAYCRTLARAALEGRAAYATAGLTMARTCDVRRRIVVLQRRIFAAPLNRRAVAGMTLAGLFFLVLVAGSRLTLANPSSAKETLADARKNDASTPKDLQPSAETVLVGRVVDKRGQPVPRARVVVLGLSRRMPQSGEDDQYFETLGLGRADIEGRWRLTTTSFSSTTYVQVDAVALADGHALGSSPIGLDATRQDVLIRLPDEEVLHGRVLDSQGLPAARAKVYVLQVGAKHQHDERKGVYVWEVEHMPAVWPQPATTDAEGRFTLRGVNPSVGTSVQVIDDRFARWHFVIGRLTPGVSAAEMRAKNKDQGLGCEHVLQADPTEEIALAPPPSQIIEGRVIYEDTQEPAPQARLTVWVKAKEYGGELATFGRTDAEGRFRINPFPGSRFDVAAYPAEGLPYLIRQKTLVWPDAARSHKIQIAVPRGVAVHGRIIESPSGKPVAEACLEYRPYDDNPNVEADIQTGWLAAAASRADGTFAITVPPGKGTLLVQGSRGYILEEIGKNQIRSGRPGGKRLYVHAAIPLNLDAKARPEISVTLRRGATIRGRIVGPDDKPVAEAYLASYLFNPPHIETGSCCLTQVVRGGEFQLAGLDPRRTTPVFILDPKNRLGAKVEISGHNANQPLVIKLQPCGSAEVRFVDPQGKPLSGHEPCLNIVFRPGPSPYTEEGRKAATSGRYVADEDINANFDFLNYWNEIGSDKDSRYVLPALIPGATYRLMKDGADGLEALDFIAEPGKTLKLRDVVLPPEPEKTL